MPGSNTRLGLATLPRNATAPVVGGESVAIRIDREERGTLRLEKLGFGYDMLKQFRRVATRYEKTARSYLAVVTIAAAVLWLR